ncbi:hypothetical protein [Caballeronia calidae]|uniref:hypothetical protein n=1 Tax=Caballeronia calidae TaxID=1777139 RepID=UPI0018DFAFA6|nr:hypothetical protein [Caballeronia calidae]
MSAVDIAAICTVVSAAAWLLDSAAMSDVANACICALVSAEICVGENADMIEVINYPFTDCFVSRARR